MYSSDKIVVKHISVKETLVKLDPESKGQDHCKIRIIWKGTKIFRLNKLSRDSLTGSNCVQLTSPTGYE